MALIVRIRYDKDGLCFLLGLYSLSIVGRKQTGKKLPIAGSVFKNQWWFRSGSYLVFGVCIDSKPVFRGKVGNKLCALTSSVTSLLTTKTTTKFNSRNTCQILGYVKAWSWKLALLWGISFFTRECTSYNLIEIKRHYCQLVHVLSQPNL